jgi:hypothetical protein
MPRTVADPPQLRHFTAECKEMRIVEKSQMRDSKNRKPEASIGAE